MSLLEVIDESFCLNDPAAAFLELIKAEPPSLLIFEGGQVIRTTSEPSEGSYSYLH